MPYSDHHRSLAGSRVRARPGARATQWALVLDARGAADLERGRARARRAHRSHRRPGRRRRPRAPHGARPRRRAGDRPARQQRQLLGPSPQPALAHYPLEALERVYRGQRARAARARAARAAPLRRDGGAIINVTSDAAVEPYEGWGGYGSSKAALEQLSAILAAEQPTVRVYAVDPGDMRTAHAPGGVPRRGHLRPPTARGRACPALLALIEGDLPERPLPGRASWRVRRRSRERARVRAARRALEATEPPEERGRRPRRGQAARRDPVGRRDRAPAFVDLPAILEPGDLLVVNVSATLPAALGARRRTGTRVRVHFVDPRAATDDSWRVVELRSADGSRPRGGHTGERLGARRRRRAAAGRAVCVRRAADARTLRRPEPVRALPRPPRRADPLRPHAPRLAAAPPTRTSTRPPRAAPRCRARAGRSRPS